MSVFRPWLATARTDARGVRDTRDTRTWLSPPLTRAFRRAKPRGKYSYIARVCSRMNSDVERYGGKHPNAVIVLLPPSIYQGKNKRDTSISLPPVQTCPGDSTDSQAPPPNVACRSRDTRRVHQPQPRPEACPPPSFLARTRREVEHLLSESLIADIEAREKAETHGRKTLALVTSESKRIADQFVEALKSADKRINDAAADSKVYMWKAVSDRFQDPLPVVERKGLLF